MVGAGSLATRIFSSVLSSRFRLILSLILSLSQISSLGLGLSLS